MVVIFSDKSGVGMYQYTLHFYKLPILDLVFTTFKHHGHTWKTLFTLLIMRNIENYEKAYVNE